MTSDESTQRMPPRLTPNHIPNGQARKDAVPARTAIHDAHEGVAASADFASFPAIKATASARNMKPLALPPENAHQASNRPVSPAAAASATTVASATAVVMVHSAPSVTTPQADSVHHSWVKRDLAVKTMRPVMAKSESDAAATQWTIAHRTEPPAIAAICWPMSGSIGPSTLPIGKEADARNDARSGRSNSDTAAR